MSCASSPAINPNSFFIETCGCAKNSVDSENLTALLEQNGMRRAESPEEAAVLIVNTCGFIDEAKKESVSVFTELREHFPDRKLAVTGCLAERYLEELKKTGAADLFVGNKSVRGIAEAVLELAGKAARISETLFYERRFFLSGPRSVYVKIAEGCENHCAFCAIPLIRGKVKSRSEESVIEEVRALVSRGVYEINLVAQDLTAFGNDGGRNGGTKPLEALLRALDGIDGLFRIRLLYIHPDHITETLLQTIAESQKILHYFDIPFQHAAAAVLKRMGRRGDRKTYLLLIETIRRLMPDAVIRSTFMAGFPGESERDAEEVSLFLREAALDWVGFFVYSREEGTPAEKMAGLLRHRLMRKKAERRKARWETVQAEITAGKMKRYIGREMPVLIEEVFQGEPLAVGRVWFQAPEVDGCVVVKGGSPKPGDLPVCRIDGANGPDLEAEALRPWTI